MIWYNDGERKYHERIAGVSKRPSSILDLEGSKVNVAATIAILLLMQEGHVGRLDSVDVVKIHASGLSGGRTIPSQPRNVRKR